MSAKLYVQVRNGKAVQVWDTPPPEGVGNNDWRLAVEVRARIIPYRQGWLDHVWNFDTDPAQLIYGTWDIAVDDRKNQMITAAEFGLQPMASGLPNNAVTLTAEQQTQLDAKIAAITAATSHDELDQIQGVSDQVAAVMAEIAAAAAT